jgi:hypothetical protein
MCRQTNVYYCLKQNISRGNFYLLANARCLTTTVLIKLLYNVRNKCRIDIKEYYHLRIRNKYGTVTALTNTQPKFVS